MKNIIVDGHTYRIDTTDTAAGYEVRVYAEDSERNEWLGIVDGDHESAIVESQNGTTGADYFNWRNDPVEFARWIVGTSYE